MINYACPKCRTAMASPDGAAGQVNKCPACGQGITVPPAAPRAKFFMPSLAESVLPVMAFIAGFLSVASFGLAAIIYFDAGGSVVTFAICICAGIAFISTAISFSAMANVLLYLRTTANNSVRAGKKPR